MIVTFTQTSFTLLGAVNYVKDLVNGSTDLSYKQRSDCVEALGQVPVDSYITDGYFEHTGAYGYTAKVNYYATRDYETNTIEGYVFLQIDTSIVPSQTVTPEITAVPTPAPSVSAWTPQPSPGFPAPGPLSANFTTLEGISVIVPASATSIDSNNTNVFLNYHIIGGHVKVFNPTNGIRASVTRVGGGNLPDYTLAELYVNGVRAVSGYSVGDRNIIRLYEAITQDSDVSLVITTFSDQASAAWIPSTELLCRGGLRFTNGSCRGFVTGASAIGDIQKYDLAMTLTGCTPNTYVKANMKSALPPYPVLNYGQNFNYTFNGTLSTNPVYGYLTPGNSFTATGGTTTGNVYDVVVEANVLEPVVPETVPLKIYTPYTFTTIGSPVWVQTVLPDSSVNWTSLTANWGDGTVDIFNGFGGSELYFAHTYTSASDVPYTLTVNTRRRANNASVTANKRFYVQNSFPVIDLSNYAETLGIYLELPYTREQVHVGSNEWAVADNINASLNKLKDNFNYLNKVTDSIKKSPSFTLVEWARDFVSYPTWNTSLSSSNNYFTLSGNYIGIIPGNTIVDFKSYKNGYAAPDFYNYIAYDSGIIQIRKNNYYNTTVNQLTAVSKNSELLNIYGFDSDGDNLYVLANINNGNNSKTYTSVYRYYVGNAVNTITPINQVGGDSGNKNDNVNFNGSQPPSAIKYFNSKVFVGDMGNRCVKVYTPALTHITTVYSNELSAYNTLQFDVNPVNGEIYVLGKLYAPNVPVITSVALSAGKCRLTWNHDGERLNQTQSPSANFNIYGRVAGTTNDGLIDSIYSNFAALSAEGAPKLTTYVFTPSATYTSYKVQAIGIDGIITSEKSSSAVVPNDVVFPSPYRIFVYNTNSKLLSSLYITEVPATAEIKKIIVEPSGVFLYVITADYIYKYTSTGIFINRISSPSMVIGSLGSFEKIVTGFVDINHYFYIATQTRLFKFTDIPFTEEIVDQAALETLYTPVTSLKINSEEYIVDWVYNKALAPLIYNHEILAKNITKKYVVTLDGKNNLVDFTTRGLSSTEYITSLSADSSNYIYSNEIVSSAVVNRTFDKLYDIQEAILDVLKPEVIRTTPSYTVNVLGKITAATGNIVYQYIPPPPTTTTPPPPLPLPNLFAYASATYVGNVYSELYNNGARYGNDYIVNFSIINATSGSNLIIDLSDNVSGNFLDIVYITVKNNSNAIFTESLVTATVYNIPLSGILTVDSSTIAPDGIKNTFGANIEIELSVGSINSTNSVKPKLTVTSTAGGKLYNTTFKNSVMDTNYPTSVLTVYQVSGDDIPYAGITNNTLGGYLLNNPYAPHSWSIDGVGQATNPTVSFVPSNTTSVTVSATRNPYTYAGSSYVTSSTTKMESEIILGLHRETQTPIEAPNYLLSTRVEQYNTGIDSAKRPGYGVIFGAGTYKAGSLVTLAGYPTDGWWGSTNSKSAGVSALSLVGPGTFNGFISSVTITLNGSEVSGHVNNATTFIDGNKLVIASFTH